MEKQEGVKMYSQGMMATMEGSMLPVAVILISVYLIKGVVMFIPIQLLYLTAGAVFGLGWGTAINIAGVVICLSVSWSIGRFFHTDRLSHFMQKYPALAAIDSFQTKNSFFFSYIIRIIGVLPCDVVSLYCGVRAIPYLPYITGSLLGMLPGIVLTGILGANIRTPGSPQFIISLLFHIFTLILSRFIYNKIIRKHKEV